MATSHGSPPPVIYHSEWGISLLTCNWTQVHHEPRGRWERANQTQKQQSYSEQDHKGKTILVPRGRAPFGQRQEL